MDGADRERLAARPHGVRVPMPSALRVGVHVDVALSAVLVNVGVEGASTPSSQDAQGEDDDDRADQRLGDLLHEAGDPCVEEHDGHAEADESNRMPRSPRRAEPTGDARLALPNGRHEGGDGDEMVRVGCVPEAEEKGDGQNDREPPSVGLSGDQAVHLPTVRPNGLSIRRYSLYVPAEPLASWQSSSYAAAWADEDVLLDLLDLPRRISAALVADEGVPVAHVVDVGAGPGAYLAVLLAAFPSARGTWLDSSQPMEQLARERLADFGDRVEYVHADAERLDLAGVGKAHVLVTSRLLHHFAPPTLQRFYRMAFEVLEPGGFFFNLDHFGTPDGWEARYRRIREEFTGPRTRELKPHRHDFPFSATERHLSWIEAAGFEPPDVPWRAFFTALIAARKPG